MNAITPPADTLIKNPTNCLATVCSDEFLPGTVTMFSSFLQHNPDFNGDLCVIQSTLSARSKAILMAAFPTVKFRMASERLATALDQLVEAQPELAARRDRFLSVELLALSDYERVLFCDSDLLFRRSITALFARGEALLCCGDAASYRGLARDPITFEGSPIETTKDGIEAPFNAGFMLFDGRLCNEDEYSRMIDLITPERWHRITTGHTDQALFNLQFSGRQTLVGPAFNYLLAFSDIIHEGTNINATEACVWHFNGPAKPWLPHSLLAKFRTDPWLLTSVPIWNKAFTDFLSREFLRETRREK